MATSSQPTGIQSIPLQIVSRPATELPSHGSARGPISSNVQRLNAAISSQQPVAGQTAYSSTNTANSNQNTRASANNIETATATTTALNPIHTRPRATFGDFIATIVVVVALGLGLFSAITSFLEIKLSEFQACVSLYMSNKHQKCLA